VILDNQADNLFLFLIFPYAKPTNLSGTNLDACGSKEITIIKKPPWLPLMAFLFFSLVKT